jgi:predicted DNA-binding transcriptional regulator AlpA
LPKNNRGDFAILGPGRSSWDDLHVQRKRGAKMSGNPTAARFTVPQEAKPLKSTAKSVGEPNGGDRLLTPKEVASYLRLSQSWLAKARMRGEGPAFLKIGRSVRYREAALVQYAKSRTRLSTSEL